MRKTRLVSATGQKIHCPHCKGKGVVTVVGVDRRTCTYCGGAGQVIKAVRIYHVKIEVELQNGN